MEVLKEEIIVDNDGIKKLNRGIIQIRALVNIYTDEGVYTAVVIKKCYKKLDDAHDKKS